MRTMARLGGILLLVGLGFGGCVASSALQPASGSFYAASAAGLPGIPGTIIRAERLDGAPLGASAFRILYRSTGLRAEPIAVSGVLVVPADPQPPEGRPVVAWAHPTSGVVPRCAPSEARFVFQQMMGLREMVRRGWVVVATDYPGLGTAGPHPYLVGTSEGRAVLDSVRAARAFAQAHVGRRFAVWGHSQGGQAALFTGLLADGYAPELELLGVAVAAPATEIGTLLGDDIGTQAGKNLTAMTLWSWSRVFAAPLGNVVSPQTIPVIDLLARECIESPIDLVLRDYTSRPLGRAFLTVPDLATVEPWRSLLAANTPGTLPPALPVFIAQGGADQIVRPAVTFDYARRLCASGSAVRMLVVPDDGHGFIAAHTATSAVEWMAARFRSETPPSDCAAINAGDAAPGR